MLPSLQVIQEYMMGNKQVLREHRWLQYLALTKEKRVNLEQVDSLQDIPENPVLQYVERTLRILERLPFLTDVQKSYFLSAR